MALSMVTCLARPVARSVAVTLRMPLRSRSSRTRIWLPAGTVGQALDRELADQGVEPGVVVLALEDADLGRLLAVVDRRVDLGPGGRQRGIAVDDRREAVDRGQPVELAQGLDAQGVRGDVDQDRADVDARRSGPPGRPRPSPRPGRARSRRGPAGPAAPRADRWTSGVRVAPPTRTTLSIWLAWSLASSRASSQAVERLGQQGLDQVLVLAPVDLQVQVQGHAVLLGDELLLDPGDGVERERLLGLLDGAEDARLGPTSDCRRSMPCFS